MSKFKLPPGATPDGELTRFGMEQVRHYALAWMGGNERDLDAERRYPELSDAFFGVRTDPDYCRQMAGKDDLRMVMRLGGQ